MNAKKDILDKLVGSHQLTADGRDWLKLTLDPFHDYNHSVAGYPDSDASQTLVSCYQYQFDMSAPNGVAGNWDAHIFTTPQVTSMYNLVVSEGNTWTWATVAAAPDTVAYGPLTMQYGPAGANLAPAVPMPVNTTYSCLPAVNVTDVSKGISRIIGMGFEVTNTTSDMYKQGAVTTYRMPQYSAPAGTISAQKTGDYTGTLPIQRFRQPPKSVAEANLLKGTRTWSAADGVYAVAALSSIDNPLLPLANVALLHGQNAAPGVTTSAVLSPYSFEGTKNAPPAISTVGATPTQSSRFDTTGAYFTGLSNQTTLTVKLKVYVERAPTHTEPELSVLATPSAGLDNMALQIYSQAISQLPIAVTVAENGLGDWFRDVARVVAKIARPIGTVMDIAAPGTGAMARRIGDIAGGMDKLLSQKGGQVTKPKKSNKKNAS